MWRRTSSGGRFTRLAEPAVRPVGIVRVLSGLDLIGKSQVSNIINRQKATNSNTFYPVRKRWLLRRHKSAAALCVEGHVFAPCAKVHIRTWKPLMDAVRHVVLPTGNPSPKTRYWQAIIRRISPCQADNPKKRSIR